MQFSLYFFFPLVHVVALIFKPFRTAHAASLMNSSWVVFWLVPLPFPAAPGVAGGRAPVVDACAPLLQANAISVNW